LRVTPGADERLHSQREAVTRGPNPAAGIAPSHWRDLPALGRPRKGVASMRRVLALLGAAVLALAIMVPVVVAAPAGAVTVNEVYPCNVGWDAASGDLYQGAIDDSCQVTNVRTANGGFTQVLHGQVPADWMDAFRAAGSPSSFATGCLVNYGWLMKYHQGEDWGPLMVFTTSVRHFTPDGKMTEVCEPDIR
jgi:hypothetical protein